MPTDPRSADLPTPPEQFVDRHIGPRAQDVPRMLETLGLHSLDELVAQAIPRTIRMEGELKLDPPLSEAEALDRLRRLAERNQVHRSFIGMGYYGTFTPPVVQRNILENPGWYTQYTPYQAEISQGRLEALLIFQTMVADLTGLPVANASLLDEATAAAEAMTLCRRVHAGAPDGSVFFVSERCHPQTIAVVRTRALPLGIEVVVGDHERWDFSRPTFGALVQHPTTCGEILDYGPFADVCHKHGALLVVATDLLALTLLRAPGEFGADVAVGNSQRFGVPLGYGGPHAAFLATKDEYKRQLPGRIIGVSVDAEGRPALRLALQTREQHIRRERATSNICTAQVLLAVMAAMYAVHHGPEGLRGIARRVHHLTLMLRRALEQLGCKTGEGEIFDTLKIVPGPRGAREVLEACRARRVNLRQCEDGAIAAALDETTTVADLQLVYELFGGSSPGAWERLAREVDSTIPAPHRRESEYLTHPVFHRHRSETELMRYIKSLENRDLSLATAMIPLGSCTMKLNAAAEMFAISWPGFANLHPFAPPEQAEGYRQLFRDLGRWLCEITGFADISFQPNSGAQGEYTGLQVIRAYHHSRGESRRHVCLIPESAHGTNPASSVLAGMDVVIVRCEAGGDIDLEDLKARADAHRDDLAALMITYPSTHGVFEEGIRQICDIVHRAGGQVYVDGANLNALVGLSRPAEFGGDVLHLNLHKTFSIPHGGGGPGAGPIAVGQHLAPFLPRHPLVRVGGEQGIGPVAAAPWGSPSILPISYAYIAMMGPEGLKRASQIAVLNANYIARRLDPHYPVVFKGKNGLVAHECIIDLRPLKTSANIDPDDVAKRLMDYGFHAPTMSWPVGGALMVEPTESESKEELDRFCEAMIMIREEIREIEQGRMDPKNNLLKNAPHTARAVCADRWDRPYSRERAVFPTAWTRERKFWPAVARVDNVYGDRHVVCTCPPVEAYT